MIKGLGCRLEGWNGIIPYATFCVWLLWLNAMFKKFIHVVARGITSFLFMSAQYSGVWTDHVLWSRSSVGGHLGCFHLFGCSESAAPNMYVYLFECLFSALWGCTPGSGIAGSCGNSVCNIGGRKLPLPCEACPDFLYEGTSPTLAAVAVTAPTSPMSLCVCVVLPYYIPSSGDWVCSQETLSPFSLLLVKVEPTPYVPWLKEWTSDLVRPVRVSSEALAGCAGKEGLYM